MIIDTDEGMIDTGARFREARRRLMLTQADCAVLCGFGSRGAAAGAVRQVRRIEIEDASVPPYAARLLEAYCAGYRPPDWPEGAAPKSTRITADDLASATSSPSARGRPPKRRS